MRCADAPACAGFRRAPHAAFERNIFAILYIASATYSPLLSLPPMNRFFFNRLAFFTATPVSARSTPARHAHGQFQSTRRHLPPLFRHSHSPLALLITSEPPPRRHITLFSHVVTYHEFADAASQLFNFSHAASRHRIYFFRFSSPEPFIAFFRLASSCRRHI